MVDPMVVPLGILIGILMSAPVGPVNILCINRTLRRGFSAGLATGLGATIGDAVLALVAAFGVTAVADMIDQHTIVLQIVGGLLIVGFGFRIMRSPPAEVATPAAGRPPTPPLRIIAATFVMTVTNPGPLLGFLAIFGGLVGGPLVPERDFASAAVLVGAVTGGALLWWVGLAGLVARIRHRFTARTLRRINLVSGALTMAFGIAILGRVLLEFVA